MCVCGTTTHCMCVYIYFNKNSYEELIYGKGVKLFYK